MLADDVFARLLSFPNVLVTAHQAFLTHEALDEIARVTGENIVAFSKGESPEEPRGQARRSPLDERTDRLDRSQQSAQ